MSDCMTLWPNGKSSRLPIDDFAGSKPGRDFESPINWNPFQLEFTEA